MYPILRIPHCFTYIAHDSYAGHYLQADDGSEGGNIKLWWHSPGSTQCQFVIQSVGNGIFTLRSRSNGKSEYSFILFDSRFFVKVEMMSILETDGF